MAQWRPTANRNTLWCAVFVDALYRGGVTQAVVAPGSRSTPLVLALAAHPGIRTELVQDERGAAFFALGAAKASGRPVAVVCTSGTAAANFHPAVAEADLSEVPLLVLTADRPPMLRHAGAAQTMDQIKLYGDAVRWFHEVGEPVMRDADLRRLRSLAAQALHQATRAPAGPVHLNFPFRKPLEAQEVPEDVPEALARTHAPDFAAATGTPYSRAHTARATAPPEVLADLAARVKTSPRGLILCGPMIHAPRGLDRDGTEPAAAWPEALAHLARRTGYPVLAEPPSGVWCGPHDTSRVIPHAEAILRTPAFRKRLAPQLVLRFGSLPTPRHVEVLLDEHPDCPVVLVNEGGRWLEPTHHPTELICAEPARFCADLAEALGPDAKRAAGDAAWLADFQRAGRLAAEALTEALDAPAPEGLAGALFEGRVLREVAARLPPGAVQFTASSMPVRDLADFAEPSANPVQHLVSRGANGIDGTLSTALGATAAAVARQAGPGVLVTGDVAFLHDAGALLTARQSGLPLTIVLLNNEGGGIFQMLPISEYGPTFERYFGTPHGVDCAALCAAHGIAHHAARDWADFRSALKRSLASGAPGVIEVRTERALNRAQHDVVWQAVARRLESAFAPPAS